MTDQAIANQVGLDRTWVNRQVRKALGEMAALNKEAAERLS
jgi:hypothetical protein